MFRAGDIVYYKPTGEKWVLACDEERSRVMWLGWPGGVAHASDCQLVEAASEDERLKTLREVSDINKLSDFRRIIAQRQLARIEEK
ncbi:MAG TPA: hypothetical protein ENI36_00605 [Thermoplasmatales archaeon]|nr:hypothetical protein [Thermoplasmatales archaeon]